MRALQVLKDIQIHVSRMLSGFICAVLTAQEDRPGDLVDPETTIKRQQRSG